MHNDEALSASAFYEAQSRFSGISQAEQVLRAAWYIQSHGALNRFQPKDITEFFSGLNLSPPNVHVNLKRLFKRKPRLILWDKLGYFLEGNCRRSMDDKYLIRSEPVSHLTSSSLNNISEKITRPSQRVFLDEALNCYQVGAFRATIVMAWNLAYDHFVHWIYQDAARVTAFANSLMIKYPKKSVTIDNIDSFAELKDFEVIEIAQHAKLISKNVSDLMKEKLKRRNAAAHPSSVTFTQAQADDAVTDLINNVVARLA